APDGPDGHIEGTGPLGYGVPDPTIAEDAESLPGELRPGCRRRRGHRPLALPVAPPEAGVQATEAAAQRHHGADHVLGDAGLVAVGIRQPRAGRKGGPVDPIEAGAG